MKKIIIAAIVVLFLAGGATGAYLYYQDNDSDSSQDSSSTELDESAATTESASINDLIARGASLKCSYQVDDEDGKNTGVAYFSGSKKMYGEFTNTVDGEENTANVIREGDTQYVWQEGSEQGFKTDVSASTKQTQKQKSDQIDPEEKYKFECSSWQEDESLFVPPSNVDFQEISVDTKQSEGAADKAKEACAKITDSSARAACEGAF